MKKTLSILIALILCTFVASAQPRAIGARLGGSAEFSYQLGTIADDFMEFDLGLSFLNNNNGFHVSGIYDFVFANVDRLNFYAGPGAQLGVWNNVGDDNKIHSSFNVAVCGQLGAELAFRHVPINLSLDWRPCWDFIGTGFHFSSLCFGVRYRF